MGCDIHLAIETKRGNRPWEPYAIDVFIWRDYRVFAKLADVRNNDEDTQLSQGSVTRRIVPIAKPRGLPSDVSKEVKEFLDTDSYYHSYSWISADEFQRAFPWDWDTLNDHHFALVGWAAIKSVYLPNEDMRFVFAFDN